MERHIYTLVRRTDWAVAEEAGAYSGSEDDRRDGFLHFSTVEADAAALGTALRFEPPASGRPGLFPHLYGSLPLSAVSRVMPLPLGADGVHAFPEGFA
ncbi:MAG: DUF952 domain-containing protein [Alphaproteobacteria bacterium]|nr:DUF952 domain-containing protein [Alphaproteobacteria bacterium]